MSKTHKRKVNKNLRKNVRQRKKSQCPHSVVCEIKKSLSLVPDDRSRLRNFRYELADVAIALVISLLRGCRDFVSAHAFITGNMSFMHRYDIFTNPESRGGCPSMPTLYRIVKTMDASKFQQVFIDFVLRLTVKPVAGKLTVLAVDGKRMNGTLCGDASRPLNVLTAFNTALRLPAFCETCDVKSNEIKAWDRLLDGLAEKLRNIVFTADAMGCQTKITDKITDMKCHYCLAVKGNQGNLESDVRTLIEHSKARDCYTEPTQIAHGRIEWRECRVFNAFGEGGGSFITDIEKWRGIKTVILVSSHRICKKTGEECAAEERIYISDLELSARELNDIIRQHWLVEIFHWILDTAFCQDKIKRTNDKDSAASKNIDTIQKFAYSILVIFEMAQAARCKDYKKKGIKAMMTAANSSNKAIANMLNTNFSELC